MTAKRKCRYVPLTKKPLVMVLAQVRFSTIENIAEYLPRVQDQFRRKGYPFMSRVEGKSIQVSPDGVRETEVAQWKFESADKRKNILLDSGQILLQTSVYERFESLVAEFLVILEAFFDISAHDQFGVVQRLGLRYIDLVRLMADGDDWQDYLQAAFHGLKLAGDFRNTLHATATQAQSTLRSRPEGGTLIVRMMQNSDGSSVPPDLLALAPSITKTEPGKINTLIDMDHFWSGELLPPISTDQLELLLFELHDTIIETFHDSVLSKMAVMSWS